MDLHDIALRFWQDLIARPEGPLSFRFILQPLVASVLASRDGLRDFRTGAPGFVTALVSGRAPRRPLLRDALHSVGRLLVVAVCLDAVYQLMVLGRIYPGEALVVALLFGFLPYALTRGLVARVARLMRRMAGPVFEDRSRQDRDKRL